MDNECCTCCFQLGPSWSASTIFGQESAAAEESLSSLCGALFWLPQSTPKLQPLNSAFVVVVVDGDPNWGLVGQCCHEQLAVTDPPSPREKGGANWEEEVHLPRSCHSRTCSWRSILRGLSWANPFGGGVHNRCCLRSLALCSWRKQREQMQQISQHCDAAEQQSDKSLS